MTPEELADRVDGIVHEETQLGQRGLDLTVAEVYEVEEPGRVDFGGGELQSATVRPHSTVWRNQDDDYQWYHCKEGTYLVEFNESLSGTDPVWLQPHRSVLVRGGTHPTLSVADLPRVPLTVSRGGLRLKENARVSTLLPGDNSQ